MRFLFVDYETRSRANLPMVGTRLYATDPSTEILMVAKAHGSLDPVVDVEIGEIDDNTVVVSWGSFDYQIYTALENPDYPRHKWVNAEALARYIGMPGGLNDFARAMRFGEKKDPRGSRLVTNYCCPQNDGSFLPLLGDDLTAMQEYNRQDVRLLQRAWRLLENVWPEWEAHMREGYEVTQSMNYRGVPIDILAVKEAIKQCNAHEARLVKECEAICGLRPSQNIALAEYLGLSSINKEALEFTTFDDPGKERVRQIRLESAKAATKKLVPMLNRAQSTGRAYDCLVFNGAHTGRGSSRDIQFQNMVKAKVDPEVFRRLHAGEALDEPLRDVQQNIRGFIRPPSGRVLVVADYSQVEARVVAWLANERSMLDAFREKRDVYREFASIVYDCTPEGVTDLQRSYGKIVVLGAGYGAGGAALARQSKNYGISMTEATGDKLKKRYREVYSGVPRLWDELEFAAIDAVRGDYDTKQVGFLEFRINTRRTILSLVLPSGRAMRFFYPLIEPDRFGNDSVTVVTKHGRRSIWGGHWLENAAQAIATDLKLNAMVRLHHAGKTLVLEVHDEIVALALEGTLELEHMLTIMEEPPSWAPKDLIRAEGSIMERYSK